jgi:4-diphosphocytidyl-2-C-methyl-D-erythritol kinase
MLLIQAHAKINLCLAVRGRRSDGFHDIDSLVVPIDWHDLVGIAVRPADATTVRLRVAGATGDLPTPEDNLAALAAAAMAAMAGPLDVSLWLDKRVPSEAGLGGGSADAAAVLRGCASLLQAPPGDEELLRLAGSIGSDVPVLLTGGARRVRGRGEELTPVAIPALHLVVAVAGASNTAATYAALQTFDFEDSARPEALVRLLDGGGVPSDDLLGSGLEGAACRANPVLDERLLALRAAVAEVRWHLTGSGGAAFAMADDAEHAAALATLAGDAGFPARACRSVSG